MQSLDLPWGFNFTSDSVVVFLFLKPKIISCAVVSDPLKKKHLCCAAAEALAEIKALLYCRLLYKYPEEDGS